MKRLLACAALAAAPWAMAADAPGGMVANVYRFAEAGAVLKICRESDAFAALPSEHRARIESLDGRLLGLVQRIARHYGDDMLAASYDATRARIAGEPKLKLHVKNSFGWCGERLRADMGKYLEENEALIDGYLKRQGMKPPAKP